MNQLLHEVENSQDTQSFLKQNGKKFSNDCIKAMQLMYSGVRLNGDTCKELYNFHDRRLRDCRQGRPDIVKSEWKRNEKGERLYVEFWIDTINPPTKTQIVEKALRYIKGEKSASDWAKELINGAKQNLLNQANLF